MILVSCNKKPQISYTEACADSNALEEVKYYVKHNILGSEGLRIAAEKNSNEKIIQELLKSKNLNTDIKNEALIKSLDNNNPNICRMLIDAGANVNIQTTDGKTLLMLACEKNSPNIELITTLINYGANVTQKDNNGATALVNMFISKNQNKEITNLLINSGASIKEVYEFFGIKMIKIPGTNIEMLITEVTQKLYTWVMDNNPSKFIGDNLPVEQVSWYDAINFCNELSKKLGLTQVYLTNSNKKIINNIEGVRLPAMKELIVNDIADGFRLPTMEEWEYAALGGENYIYAGSNNIDEVAWYSNNSNNKTHPVAQKKPNKYGLYDMSGNVWEWNGFMEYGMADCIGGGWAYNANDCEVDTIIHGGYNPNLKNSCLGFRVVKKAK